MKVSRAVIGYVVIQLHLPSGTISGNGPDAMVNINTLGIVRNQGLRVKGGKTYQEERRKPETGRNEAERLRRLPPAAVATPMKSSPVERVAAVDLMDQVDKDAEGREPGSRHEQVERVVHHAAGRRDQPDQRGENRKRSDDNGVDLASLWSCPILVVLVKEVGHETEDDGSRDKLSEAEEQRGHTREDHGFGVSLRW